MKSLLLLRHAKSDWSGGEADFDRPLNARGRAAAARMGTELAHEAIDQIGCSPARRTRETLDLLSLSSPVTFDPRIYEAGIGQLAEVIGETDGDVRCLLLVGHMPAIAGVALWLARGDEGAEYRRVSGGYPTAALARLKLEIDRWGDLASGCGLVERFVRPNELD